MQIEEEYSDATDIFEVSTTETSYFLWLKTEGRYTYPQMKITKDANWRRIFTGNRYI